ncbi:hypothetical protein RHGRI_035749 [Rhododendron griersonianum]|uniref:Uncharacterized protein n=1 Tax=Rhododendron griersonianum TaxID=479676 RepID=A0AAV6HQX7_9ERIC|nr:hypothetical protein RHGRI_035749 [Rhododendron griersonianum]
MSISILTIGMGFTVCIFTSLLIFRMWASDELHSSTSLKCLLAVWKVECMEEYFSLVNEKEKQFTANFASCKIPFTLEVERHIPGKFFLMGAVAWKIWDFLSWEKYQQIGDAIGELSVTIVSLRGCLQSPRQSSKTVRRSIKEPCEAVGLSLTWTLRELRESIMKMQMCRPKALIASKLQSINLELSLVTSSIVGASENSEELGELAGF